MEESADQSFCYYFINRNNCIYTVYLDLETYQDWLKDFPHLLSNGYALSLFRENPANSKLPEDELLFPTIYKILLRFFKEEKDAVILYHCDYSDGKQAARHKKFSKWESMVESSSIIERKCVEVEFEDSHGNPTTHYLGLIIRKDNGYLKEIFEEFSLFTTTMISHKPSI